MKSSLFFVSLVFAVLGPVFLGGCAELDPQYAFATCPECGHYLRFTKSVLAQYEGRGTCNFCGNVLLVCPEFAQTPSPAYRPSGTSDSYSSHSSAQAEYSAALKEYNDALDALNVIGTVNDLYNLPFPLTSRSDAAIKFLGQLGTGMGRADAERRVEVGRQRLETAKERLVAESGRTQVNVNVPSAGPSVDQVSYYDGKMADGGHYVGQVRNNKQHGFGTRTWPNGSKYTGAYVDGKKQGHGTLYNADKGVTYVGQFVDDERSGHGTVIAASGMTYVGEFRNDAANGRGILTTSTGQRYEGEFQKAQLHGRGVWIDPNDGQRVVGEWRDGKLNGQGIETYPDGKSYAGEWKDGKYHGFGKLTMPDGTIKEGYWRNGELIGQGTQPATQEAQQQQKDQFVACSYYRDFDEDGVPEHPTEFVGIRSQSPAVFLKSEQIAIYGIFARPGNHRVKYRILDASEKEIRAEEKHIENGGTCWVYGPKIEAGSYDPGYYVVIFSLDGQVVGTLQFQVKNE